MLARTLQQLIDQKITTAREIGELTGVSTSTVYRWISRESQPEFNAVRLLLRYLPDRRGQEALLGVFLAGTDWTATHQDLALDVNHDGRIDAEDALDASIEAVHAAGRSVAEVRSAGRRGNLSPEQTLELIGLLNNVIRQSTITQRVLLDMTEQRKKRKLKLAE